MAKFKVGDKVIAKKGAPYSITTDGWRGTVVDTLENPNGHFIVPGDEIRVQGDDWSTYSVESKYFDFDESTSKSNQKIVITTDGKTTTAKLYDGKKFVKAAKAKCSPDDVFDFNVGALLSVGRLVNADCELSENDSFDWTAFKNNKFFVQVTKDNFDNFVEEAKKHGCCFTKSRFTVNPFINRFMMNFLTYEKFISLVTGILCAPEDTVYISCVDNLLKFSVGNPDKKTVFVW